MLCKYIPTVNILLAPVLPLLKQSKHWGKHIKQTRRKDLHTLADFYDVRERHPSLPNPAYLIPTVLSNAFLLIYMTWRRRKFPFFLPLLSVDLTYVSFIGAGSRVCSFCFFFLFLRPSFYLHDERPSFISSLYLIPTCLTLLFSSYAYESPSLILGTFSLSQQWHIFPFSSFPVYMKKAFLSSPSTSPSFPSRRSSYPYPFALDSSRGPSPSPSSRAPAPQSPRSVFLGFIPDTTPSADSLSGKLLSLEVIEENLSSSAQESLSYLSDGKVKNRWFVSDAFVPVWEGRGWWWCGGRFFSYLLFLRKVPSLQKNRSDGVGVKCDAFPIYSSCNTSKSAVFEDEQEQCLCSRWCWCGERFF